MQLNPLTDVDNRRRRTTTTRRTTRRQSTGMITPVVGILQLWRT
jgi:hypothetical protein